MKNEESPAKRTKIIDYRLCIVCQEHKSKLKLVKPTENAYTKLLEKMHTRQRYADLTYADTVDVLDSISHIDLGSLNGKWHTDCYKYVTNQTKINRLIDRFGKLKKTSDIPIVLDVKVGRPSKDPSDSNSQDMNYLRPRRYSTFSKHECVLYPRNRLLAS